MRTLAFLLCLVLPTVAGAQALPGRTPMTEVELAEARGGFRLPGGMEVRLAITTDTSVDGRLVFRTLYNLDQSTPQFRVLGRTDGANGPTQVALTDGGVTTRDGVIRLLPNGARFTGDGLEVSHLAGQAIGTVLANSGSDRTIDLATTVDIQISGVTPAMLGSSALRVEGLALDATSRLTR